MLSGTFELPTNVGNLPGRPSKSFKDCSERIKRRKTEEMRSTSSEDAIVHVANTTLQAQGKRNASKILRDITNSPISESDQAEIYCLTPLQTPINVC